MTSRYIFHDRGQEMIGKVVICEGLRCDAYKLTQRQVIQETMKIKAPCKFLCGSKGNNHFWC